MNLILWQLLITACMRDLWVRQGLIHGMLLRGIGSFLRCNDTLVHSGSGKRNVRKTLTFILALNYTLYSYFT